MKFFLTSFSIALVCSITDKQLHFIVIGSGVKRKKEDLRLQNKKKKY